MRRGRCRSGPCATAGEEASTAPIPGFTALQAFRAKGRIDPGQRVLVNGAAGGVGTYAVQIAKSWGAEVTGVYSTNPDMVRAIGADHIVDYKKRDFTRTGERYDLILDTVGNRSLSDAMRAVRPDGTYVAVAGPILRALWLSMTGGDRKAFVFAKPNMDDLVTLQKLLEEGVVRPVIDRTYPLSETADALRYVGEGHVQGKVVVSV